MVIDTAARNGSHVRDFLPAVDWRVQTITLPFRTEADRYYDLLALNASDLERALVAEIEREHAQPEAERYRLALARLTAWLELDHEDARILAAAWERALEAQGESVRRGAVESERGAILNGMSFESFQRLSRILPWLRDDVATSNLEMAAAA